MSDRVWRYLSYALFLIVLIFILATFFDYGNAFNSFREPDLQYAAGVGFRLRLPVVTLGVDVAQPLSRSGSPRLHINFSPKL